MARDRELRWSFFLPFGDGTKGLFGGGVSADTLDEAINRINAEAAELVRQLDSGYSYSPIAAHFSSDAPFGFMDLYTVECPCCGEVIDHTQVACSKAEFEALVEATFGHEGDDERSPAP